MKERRPKPNYTLLILRREKKLTQKELAERCGVSKETIAKIEQGHVTPLVTTAVRIAKVLDVSVEDIWGDENRI